MFLPEKLLVYQKALELADHLIEIISASKPGLMRPLFDQALRAVTSIAANIAEGNGRFTRPDRKRFFHIARGSLFECLAHFHFLRKFGILSSDQEAEFRKEINEICLMLNALIWNLDHKRHSHTDKRN